MSAEANRELVREFWTSLYQRDWERVSGFFAADAEYTDVPTPSSDLAIGPKQIVARLRLGLDLISRYEHSLRLMVAEGDAVVTEHTETWYWDTGEMVMLPFVSVQELRNGAIVRWWDYWDLQTLMGASPAWWIEHIAKGYSRK